MRHWVLFASCFSISVIARSQDTLKPGKLAPPLVRLLTEKKAIPSFSYRITINASELTDSLLMKKFAPGKVYSTTTFSVYRLLATKEELDREIVPNKNVIFIEQENRIPREELQISNLDLSLNKINLLHRYYPGVEGEGIVVSVKEELPDTNDIDFKDRFLQTTLSSDQVSSHASIMATMIGGAGNSWYLGRGVARGGIISSSDFSTLLPDADSDYEKYKISVQNHSYGVGVESYYGSDAMAFDLTAIQHPGLLHVFSSGNSGNLSAGEGPYAGLTGWANLTGSFKMAKNILTVGATDSFTVVEALSSKGPAHDGRVKPELVAYGEDGSSGAAALVSGTALVLQQEYRDLFGSFAPNALVKAILINSAEDVGIKEVDYSNGFGSLDAFGAVTTVRKGRFFSGSVSNGGEKNFQISVPAGIHRIKITLAWNDPPGEPNTVRALVNDLDLELKENSTNITWLPWVLNPSAVEDSLQLPAARKRDTLNNVEQITLENPVGGNYDVIVRGFRVTGDQDFFIAYQLDSTFSFQWNFPTNIDYVLAATPLTMRWNAPTTAIMGKLEFSLDEGTNWQLINEMINLQTGYYQWQVPDISGTGLLRMTIGNETYITDTFTISPRLVAGTGFNCPDSFLIYWEKLNPVGQYRVSQLGERYMEPFLLTADSLVVLSKMDHPSRYYSVAPIIDGREGVRSYTFDYTLQGVECYFRSFLATIEGDSVRLDILLGSGYGLNQLIIEKFDGTSFQPLGSFSNPQQLQFKFYDSHPGKGINRYKVKLLLNGSRVLYSEEVSVFFFATNAYIVYPNPAVQGLPLHILISDPFALIQLRVFDSYGRMVLEQTLGDTQVNLPSITWSKGLYFFQFIKEGRTHAVIKVLVQ